jgi:hypothetical protein
MTDIDGQLSLPFSTVDVPCPTCRGSGDVYYIPGRSRHSPEHHANERFKPTRLESWAGIDRPSRQTRLPGAAVTGLGCFTPAVILLTGMIDRRARFNRVARPSGVQACTDIPTGRDFVGTRAIWPRVTTPPLRQPVCVSRTPPATSLSPPDTRDRAASRILRGFAGWAVSRQPQTLARGIEVKIPVSTSVEYVTTRHQRFRGPRDAGYPAPPAQIRASPRGVPPPIDSLIVQISSVPEISVPAWRAATRNQPY